MRPLRDATDSRSSKRALAGIILSAIIIFAAAATSAQVVENLRYWTAPDHTRVVLDLSGPAGYEVKRYTDPERLAVNVTDARFRNTGTIAVDDPALHRLRRNALNTKAQVVLDLTSALEYRHFVLKANGGRPDRIVVDVYHGKPAEAPTAATGENEVFTVVIDPGHGGMDPGAIRAGIREKDVVLKIARELARLLEAQPGFRAELTRTDDYFVSLGDRVRFAKRKDGDLFLSIHTNTHDRSSISGLEVYILSMKGATDREARELANKENASDLVGLAPQERVDDEVLSILMDLRMAQVLDSSSRLAGQIVGEARRSDLVKARSVKQAGFRVLHSLAMPSVLIEAAYLSNSHDRRLLSTAEGQKELAQLLHDGVMRFMNEQQPELYAATDDWHREYRVRRGDTLWDLARDHGTTIGEIRSRNKLTSDGLRIGQKIVLP